MSKIKILIAEDHNLTADLLSSVLSSRDDIEVIGVASDGVEVLRLAGMKSIDIVLLDLGMPLLDGIETIERLQKSYPQIKILVLSGYTSKSYVSRAFELGAAGYISKTAEVADVFNALHAVNKGSQYLDHRLVHIMATESGRVIHFEAAH